MSNKRKPFSVWGLLNTEIKKDPRLTIAAYLIVGAVMLFAIQYLFTGLAVFRWLAYLLLAVLIALSIGNEVANIRKHFRRKNVKKPER